MNSNALNTIYGRFNSGVNDNGSLPETAANIQKIHAANIGIDK